MAAPRCISCGYDLAGLTRGHRRGVCCPECGDPDAARRPPGEDLRANGLVMVGGVILLCEALMFPSAAGVSPGWKAAAVLAVPIVFAAGLFVWAARIGHTRTRIAVGLAGMVWLFYVTILVQIARS